MGAVFRVLSGTIKTKEEAAQAVRDLRHMTARSQTEGHILLLCCLPDAPGEQMPGDDAVIRTLQSGVMAMRARSAVRFDLLVLGRIWSDAARVYAGDPGSDARFAIVRDLLTAGKTDAAFAAATISPSALKSCFSSFSAVLVSSLSLSCTPDTPDRMLAALPASPCGCISAPVFEKREYPQSVLSRLLASGFSLCPPLFASRRIGDPEPPRMYSADALAAAVHPQCAPSAKGCAFVRRNPLSLSSLLHSFHCACLLSGGPPAFAPLAQLLLLLLSALSGSRLLLAAALAAELPVLLHPSRLPCALLRLALLPAAAFSALDALLMRATAHTRYLRLRVPPSVQRENGSMALGALLLAAALRGVHTLPALLPVSLLWLASPLVYPALGRPTIARIPLQSEQLAHLRSEAEGLFFPVCSHAPDPCDIPLRMLCEAAGCMLRQIEPDEAARRTQALLAQYLACNPPPAGAADQASMLACAQYFREQMHACDAAMRPLPAQIESCVLSMPPAKENSPLCAFLLAARQESSAAFSRAFSGSGAPLDALFLPLAPARSMPPHAITLPLSHPHTYIAMQNNQSQKQEEAAVSPGRFLAAAAAALLHPFYPLFMRSPVAAPYAALLSLPPDQSFR